ncbi:MAG: hypothetical protein WCD04_01060, partial [Terriglobia bacterium]
EHARPAWCGWQEEFAAATRAGAQAAMPVAQAARLAMPAARAARLVLLVARTARLAERRVEAREGLGRLRRGRQNQSRAPALRARGLAHSGIHESSLVFANDGGVD